MGAGWSGLAAATFLRKRGHDIRIFEATDRPGGRVATLRQDGYLVEAGPHGVIPSDAATLQLLEASGVPLVQAPPRAPRFVVHRGHVLELPTKPPQILKTPLLSAAAKVRLLSEPLHRAGPPSETVGAFAKRRLGRGPSHLVDAFVTGVYAGDPDRLVLEHSFPALHKMDQNGGILRNIQRPAGPRPALTTALDGMESLARGLAAKLDITYDTRVVSAKQDATAVTITTDHGAEAFDQAIFATDPSAVSRILGLTTPAPPTAPVHVVAFAVPDAEAPPEGYGVLAPEREGVFVLGALFESRLFPHRAPSGEQLVRCLVGGRRHPERAAMPHPEIARRAWDALTQLGLVRGYPTRTFHIPTQGIPQPEAGHAAWLAALPRGRIRVLGIGHHAVGLDALAAQAHALTAEIA